MNAPRELVVDVGCRIRRCQNFPDTSAALGQPFCSSAASVGNRPEPDGFNLSAGAAAVLDE